MSDLQRLSAHFKDQWSKLPASERNRLEPLISEGHAYLLSIRAGNEPAVGPKPEREFLLAYSILHDDPDGLLRDLEATETYVDGHGLVYFGGATYDETDPRWIYCPFAWDETGPTPGFNNHPQTIEIPNDLKIYLLGDWGGNNAAARDCARQVTPGSEDLVIHLGDVYYAGTNQNGRIEKDYQKEHFLKPWPGPAGRSFALNSNHDMYAHATGYFNTTLKSSLFQAQAGCSYFALYNDSYRIVGLDSAYYDKDQSGWPDGFMIGDIGPIGPGTQAQFLSDQASLAQHAGAELIILSHHTGLTFDGSERSVFGTQVMQQIAPYNGRVTWYWGHVHIGAVYKTYKDETPVFLHGRCCGHSCIPWGVATDLNAPNVEWYEKKVEGPGVNYFVANGFATLTLGIGGSLTEAFYRQDGSLSWSKSTSQ